MNSANNNEIPVLIIGSHGEIIELCELLGRDIIGLIQDAEAVNRTDYPTLGSDQDIEQLRREYEHAAVVISPDAPEARHRLDDVYASAGFTIAELTHPGATISPSCIRDSGAVIQTGVNISADSRIGRCVKVNTSANIMHDCDIGNYVTIAPNAVVLGHVTLSDECYVGAGAIILPGIDIGANAIVGAGAVVTANVSAGTTVVGNPAREVLQVK